MSTLSEKHFHDEAAAYAWVEARVWPQGPICPHCGGIDRISRMGGKSTRLGTYKCYQCRKPFTVKVGTVFEASHVSMRLWLQAMFLLTSSKKGISSNQLHRTLGVTLKTAWFMSHRIREAMRTVGAEPLGGLGRIVEADETYHGRKNEQPTMRADGRPYNQRGGRAKFGPAGKRAVVALVERGGSVRSFHVDKANKETVAAIVEANVSRAAILNTDESPLYPEVAVQFAGHGTVRHSADQYVKYTNALLFPTGEPYVIHTNTVEGYFSVFKRGMKGVYQHCAEKHLHRYLAEFDFRYNNRVALGVNDAARADQALKGIVGKRLTYKTPH